MPEALPPGWCLAQLDQLGTVERGRSRHRPRNAPHLYGGPYPFVQTGDVKAAGLRLYTYTQTYSAAGLEQSRLWPAGTLCITIAANICDTAILGMPACFPDSIVGFTPDQNVADSVFVKYALDVAKKRFTDISRGATQDNLSVEKMLSQRLLVPPLPMQRRIASILGAYDDLIEVNGRRIAVLEEMARRLFDEWFVQFRFPGHEGHAMVDTEQGRLPEGWRRAPIRAAYEALFDGPHATPAPATDGPVFLGIGNVTETGRLDLSSVRHIAEADFNQWTKRVTPRHGDIVFTYEATLNRYALIPDGFRGCLGRRLALIRANTATGHNLFLYLYFFTSDWREVIAGNTLSGATVDRIPLTRFPDFPITLPSDGLIARFHQIAQPIIDQIQSIERARTNLRAQRDLLLPRLISGDLSVSAAEAELEAAA